MIANAVVAKPDQNPILFTLELSMTIFRKQLSQEYDEESRNCRCRLHP
jgi:hypothetical protein